VKNNYYHPARVDRRMKFFGSVVLVLIVLWWVYMFKIRNTGPAKVEITPTNHVITNSGNPNMPEIKFPDRARSDNPQVNNFVVDFLNVLLANDYKNYRLKVTQRREPINMKPFEEAFGRVKTIEVKGIEKIVDAKVLKEMKMEDITPPVYRVAAHVVLRDKTERDVEIRVFKEGERWVSSH
jgi:hypothetical protein